MLKCKYNIIYISADNYTMQKAKKDSELSPELEKLLDDIDSGKVKMARYKNVDEYLKHVDKTISE